LHVLPRKGLIADHRCPLIIVILRSDGVHSKIDSGTSTQSFASRIVKLAAVAMFLWGRFVAPVHFLFHEGCPSLTVDAERLVVVSAAGFKEQNAGAFGGLGEECGEGATSRTA
jgi:hypothetical protein